MTNKLVAEEKEMGKSHVAETSPVTAVLRMEGAGDASYVKYSSGQANINAELRPMLADAIAKYAELPTSGPIRVADLGCSVGANALGFADCITKAVIAKASTGRVPEVQYFFSDLPSNDFNNLFLSLAPLQCSDDETVAAKMRNYFAAAVPGSFYDRLFPENSLHVVMSAWSMHWLSHVSAPIIHHEPHYFLSHECGCPLIDKHVRFSERFFGDARIHIGVNS